MSAESNPVPPAVSEEVCHKFESKDGMVLKLTGKAVKKSQTLAQLIDSMEFDDPEKCEPIPLANIRGTILDLVFQWCENYKETPDPETDDSVPKNVTITEFEAKLMDIDNNDLFDLICAANYLNVKGLLDVSCKKVANMAKGKSPEELRVIYNIPTDEEDEAAEKAAKEEAAAAEKAAKDKAAAGEKGAKDDEAAAEKTDDKNTPK